MEEIEQARPKPQINWVRFNMLREQQQHRFFEQFSYFRDDGKKSVQAIEDAMRNMNVAPMIVPANRLMEDAEYFGAEALADHAAALQLAAQNCLTRRERPDHMLRDILNLRPLFFTSIAEMERHSSSLARKEHGNPLVRRSLLNKSQQKAVS